MCCAGCDRIVQAPAPSRPIDRGMAGPGLLAHVLTAKFADYVGFLVMLWSFGVDAWILDFANLKTT